MISNYPGSFLSCKVLLQCQTCELVFADKLPSKGELNEYYSTGLFHDKDSNPYNPSFLEFSHKLSESRLSLIFKHIDTQQTSPKVIDIGAGNARFGFVLKELHQTAVYDAVEPDLEIRKKYGSWVNNQFHEINDVKVMDYDLVILNQVLEHVPDPVDFLEFVCALLKQNGYLYIDVPFKDYLFKPNVEGHVLFFNKHSMSRLLKKLEMDLIFCDTTGMPHDIAKKYFFQSSFVQKLINPWLYMEKINQMIRKIGLDQGFDTFKRFQADHYGGNRQWLRCIAKK